ncbi:MAG: NAD(P)/FAD-dependent oxidoreductase [Rhodospirillales bacterium]
MSTLDTAECDVVVIGAGVVGLAVARALAMAGREVLILEAADAIGTITSSRNSEVIHAGIYYAAGSLMAKFCVRGRNLLYDYCASHGVGHNRCGKLIVACDAQEPAKLSDIAKRAAVNGVDDMRVLSASEAMALEPALGCTGALLSPSTGIVDSHGLMLACLGDAEDHGAALALNAPVERGTAREGGVELIVGGAAPMRLLCRMVINSAGLEAPVIASRIEGVRPEAIPKRYFAKGSYYALQGRNPFQRLIYPVPVPGGLGVHLTIDLAGQARFGPDVQWVEELDYDVDPRRAESFYAAVRRYWPALKDGALVPAYSGIRPKIVPPGAPGQDFILQDANSHGVAGLINLLGIESPGLTSSLAIGEAVEQMVRQ